MSDQLSASSFALFMIRFQSLACSQAAIFIDLSESFSTLLIASFLDWISLAFLFHKLQYNFSGWFRKPSRGELQPARRYSRA